MASKEYKKVVDQAILQVKLMDVSAITVSLHPVNLDKAYNHYHIAKIRMHYLSSLSAVA